MGKYLVFFVWGAIAIFLVLASINSETSSAILAEVEPQRHSISFPKAVRVIDFYVVPGQQVKKGDSLLRVERPDLLFDTESKLSRIDRLTADLEKKRAQRDNQLYLNEIQFSLRRNELKNQIQQFTLMIGERKNLSEELEKLKFMETNPPTDSVLEENLKLLVGKEATLDQEQFVREQEIKSVFELERASILAEIGQLEKEVELLKQEEKELIQFSRVDGAIGSIYVEIEQLVPAYTNLVSVYENNPTIIRAYTNEHNPISIESGMEVFVESTNRQYRIKGEVIEIGSRIIEYPQRLRTFDQLPSWGRELFIKIPKESKFLNGEKVFVILED